MPGAGTFPRPTSTTSILLLRDRFSTGKSRRQAGFSGFLIDPDRRTGQAGNGALRSSAVIVPNGHDAGQAEMPDQMMEIPAVGAGAVRPRGCRRFSPFWGWTVSTVIETWNIAEGVNPSPTRKK